MKNYEFTTSGSLVNRDIYIPRIQFNPLDANVEYTPHEGDL